MAHYNEQEESDISMLVTERYWEDIEKAFKDNADTLTKQVYYNGNYYQCRMSDNDFCIGASYLFSEREKVYMDYKQTKLTKFAKQIAYAQEKLFDAMCISDEITHSEIGYIFKNGISDDLLIKISKRYAKYISNETSIDVDNGDVQTCQDIINEVVDCCEEHNWFK